MTVNIIYAHPETKGHCSEILENVKKELEKRELKFKVTDLYKIKYDPILSNNEHYTSGNREISKENKKIQKMIADSQLLIFIYPIWWGQMPAILKGFIDRVFVSGFAYKFVNNKPKGLLLGKKSINFITSGGPSIMYVLLRKMMNMNIFSFCGIDNKMYQIGGCRKLTKSNKKTIKKMVSKAFNNV